VDAEIPLLFTVHTVYSHHKFDHEYDYAGVPRVSYVVCSTPRSGSSLLCDVLASTELAGAPTEFFDRNQMDEFYRRWGIETLDEFLEALIRKKTSPSGIFGVKAHYPQLRELRGRDVREALPNLRCVHITRRDRVAQAVSYWRAIQTEQWASDHQIRRPGPIYFDADEIQTLLGQIERQDRMWEEFFREQPTPTLRIEYEQMVVSLDRTVLDVLRFLDVELPASFRLKPPSIQKQADKISEDWAARFLAIEARRGAAKAAR
jgi:trehalose 2-sulfotransferase